MAEIRIRPKRRSLAWLWILLTLAVLALVAWYLISRGMVRVRSGPTTGPTAAVTRLAAHRPLPWS